VIQPFTILNFRNKLSHGIFVCLIHKKFIALRYRRYDTAQSFKNSACERCLYKINFLKFVILSRLIEMHSHNRSTPTLIAQCFVRIFFSLTLFSYCGTIPYFCICKTSEEMNAFGKNIILRISGDRSHMTEFLCYDRESEFIA
jgi:hypothetical protein